MGSAGQALPTARISCNPERQEQPLQARACCIRGEEPETVPRTRASRLNPLVAAPQLAASSGAAPLRSCMSLSGASGTAQWKLRRPVLQASSSQVNGATSGEAFGAVHVAIDDEPLGCDRLTG